MLSDLTTNFVDILHHPGRVFPAVSAMALGATAVVVVVHLVLARWVAGPPVHAGGLISGRSWFTLALWAAWPYWV